MYNNYIAIEGLDGSGKTTACNIIIDSLKKLGVEKIISTREPGGTHFSEKLRNLILDHKVINNEVINDKAEMLMFYAARIQLIETVVKPALKIGSWVISDRHDISTQAYQGGGRNIDQKIIEKLRNIILGDFRPGLTFYLDVIPEIGLRRICPLKQLDRIEQESIVFFNRTRKRYLELAEQDNSVYKIDATQSLEKVSCIIRKTIIRWFQEQKV